MENKKKKISIIITSVIMVALLAISITYAFFSARNTSTDQGVQAGTVRVVYTDNLDSVIINNIAPIYDSNIMTEANKYSFNVSNTGTATAYVDISLTNIVMDAELSNLEFKWALYSGSDEMSNGNFRNVSNNEQLLTKNIELAPSQDRDYQLYIWISESDLDQSNLMNKTFSANITVMGNQTKGADLLSTIIKNNNSPIVTETPDLNTVATTDEGLIQGTDEDGETYYFRGAVEDNYVKINDEILTDDTGSYVSNNVGKFNTTATSKIIFIPTQDGTLSFDWKVSSESNHDKLNITLNGTNLVTDQSGEQKGEINQAITSGTKYTLEFSYNKDNSTSDGADKASISNLSITSIENPTWITEGEYGFEEGKINYFLWRIVRINGDGTIRLVTNHSVGNSVYNENYENEKYVGYTYDNSSPSVQDGTNSTIKTYLENWYTTNMADYDNLIANTRYCNDTSVSSTSATTTYYGAYGRNVSNRTPSFICPNTNKNYGGEYDLKVGLLSTDEMTFAGGRYSANAYHYLNNGTPTWLNSPYIFNLNKIIEFSINSGGSLSYYNVNTSRAVVPAINLRSDILYTSGNGTIDNPYIISSTT